MKKLLVTRPYLPPLEEFQSYLQDIWENKWLTNDGKYHSEFEHALCNYLGVKYLCLCNSGTQALLLALKVLGIKGEVITTPFSFVATTHVLTWNQLKPVFVDIEKNTFNLDPGRIEEAVTPETSAILPVHVYGNPCNVKAIDEIAQKHGLKVLYDACHTFGVELDGIPVLNFGHLSVMSFHATKVFQTFEGGAVICHDAGTKRKLELLKNFGFTGETSVEDIGINGKMNEFQAALGMLQLKYIDNAIAKRKQIAQTYRKELKGIPGITCLNDNPGVKHCYSYFPILINAEKYGITRDELYEKLKKNNIYGRRYFYPLISQFPIYSGLKSAKPSNLPTAEKITREVICLPLYTELKKNDAYKIIQSIKKVPSQ